MSIGASCSMIPRHCWVSRMGISNSSKLLYVSEAMFDCQRSRRAPDKHLLLTRQRPLINPARHYTTQSSALHSSSAPPLSTPSSLSIPTTSFSTQAGYNPNFPLSPVPSNPLGEGNYIRTAAALIIGDEILNGKTWDKNSHYFAKYCFENGIELKRIEVISDKEDEIIEASRRMVKNYDFVITTGGIGPTHDDITYEALAKAFGQDLAHHPETIRRMDVMYQYRTWPSYQTPEQKEAFRRMALFPNHAEVLFVGDDMWVPVVRLEGKLCIFPGIPSLFQKMLKGLTPLLPLPPQSERPLRIQVFTERPESMIAPYLTTLQNRLKSHKIQIGSYPVMGRGVFVSLIGREANPSSSSATKDVIFLTDVAREVEREISGKMVSEEEVARKKEEVREAASRTNAQTQPVQKATVHTKVADFSATVTSTVSSSTSASQQVKRALM